jgi:CubicO group peptidase (beta-lactamase class C family)
MGKGAGINASVSTFLSALKKQSRVILTVMSNPYSLEKLTESAIPQGLIQTYEDNKNSQELSAQLIFGGIKANGTLPVSAGKYKYGQGMEIANNIRLKFTVPEELGIQSASLSKVDSLAKLAIKMKATPGCQVLIAKDGKVFYNKAFGFHTYAPTQPVETSDLYDIASITKVAASTISIMKLVDEGFIDVDKKVGDYIPFMNQTNKGEIRLRDILAHQAGLPAWIPFFNKTIATASKRNQYYRSERSDTFPHQVAEKMFLRFDYPDTLLAQIAACSIDKKPDYKYSDLGYYFFKYIIENHTHKRLDEYVASTFYQQMGLNRMTYNPLRKFDKLEIVPTENDKSFRKQLVHGYVHDQGAAMMDGVGGHAGLFSNATDLAALMQMLLNYGEYGGDRYLSEAVIKEFTRCQFCENDNRRGLGFDKPQMDYNKTGPTCKCVSSLSFGHTGFTGTIAWVDPDKKLIYVFLSNRVYPDAENKKINTLATRVEIQEAIYDLL